MSTQSQANKSLIRNLGTFSASLMAILLYPVVWLLLLPFRLVGVVVTGVFRLLQAIVTLPARILGWRPPATA